MITFFQASHLLLAVIKQLPADTRGATLTSAVLFWQKDKLSMFI